MEGKVTIPYNLKWLVFILLLPFYAIYWLWKGLSWLIDALLMGLAAVCLSFYCWIKSLFNKQSPSRPSSANSKKQPIWPWILLVAAVLFLIFFLFKSCKKAEEPATEPIVENALQDDTLYYESFDDAVIASAYLNGVQKSVVGDRKWAVGLVGIKFVNGKPITDYKWDAHTTYKEAVRIIADEWRPVLRKNLNPDVKLSKDQLTAILLAAMRMGAKRFAWSSLCQKLNEGKYEEAAECFVLENKDQTPMVISGDEPLQYMRVLRFMYEGGVSARELIDYPVLGYRDLPHILVPGQSYTNEEMLEVLKSGNNKTPRQRLGLH